MSVPIPSGIKKRLVAGIAVITVTTNEQRIGAVEAIERQALEGDWLIEFGKEGTSVAYRELCMDDICDIQSSVIDINNFVLNRVQERDEDWWIGIIPLKSWYSVNMAELREEYKKGNING